MPLCHESAFIGRLGHASPGIGPFDTILTLLPSCICVLLSSHFTDKEPEASVNPAPVSVLGCAGQLFQHRAQGPAQAAEMNFVFGVFCLHTAKVMGEDKSPQERHPGTQVGLSGTQSRRVQDPGHLVDAGNPAPEREHPTPQYMLG